MECNFAADPRPVANEWRDLAARALVPSGLNSPELVLPALTPDRGIRLATVRDAGGLRMVLPLARQRFPALLTGTTTPISFYGMPHLDAELAVPALTAFLRRSDRPVLLHSVPCGGPLWDALTAAAGHFAVIEQWQRAGLDLTGTYNDWFESNFDRKRRKEYRRLRARLAEQGRFAAERMMPGDDTFPWVADFLTLEAASWKGRRGTAIDTDAAASAMLHEASAGLAASGKLRFWKLSLDGRAIAMLYAVVEGGQAWLGKIAHDDSLARFSPGVLQILQATEDLFAEGTITHVDSCAIPDHPMIDHIWRGRLAVADVLMAPGSMSGLRFTANLAAERARRRLRGLAKDMFYKLTGRHRS